MTIRTRIGFRVVKSKEFSVLEYFHKPIIIYEMMINLIRKE